MSDESPSPCRLYLITPPRLDNLPAFAESLKGALDAGDVACLQIRLKDVADDVIRRVADVLLPLCHAKDIAVLMNDRPDLAKKTGCDGVHIGQEDMPYKKARALLGPDALIGVTCHDSRHLAMIAGEDGADYVAFGAFFPTETKEAPTQADTDLLRWWSEVMLIPSVAIGGLTVENCREVVETGTDFLAVSSGVWTHPEGPAAAVKAFNALFEAVHAEALVGL
ncbi:MAG: thiamine phosphate synthase [Rhodospirillum sp.]|nr:thiamine phosphate synthase [Rhodospirillum sp.]MCF8488024.1 thiamine phosphate synthase [Rhodospirillum sp.]MCF8500291.1 thiamine phosphate synthase [Rhodospirillum sp.]